jgi:hypothetical protein
MTNSLFAHLNVQIPQYGKWAGGKSGNIGFESIDLNSSLVIRDSYFNSIVSLNSADNRKGLNFVGELSTWIDRTKIEVFGSSYPIEMMGQAYWVTNCHLISKDNAYVFRNFSPEWNTEKVLIQNNVIEIGGRAWHAAIIGADKELNDINMENNTILFTSQPAYIFYSHEGKARNLRATGNVFLRTGFVPGTGYPATDELTNKGSVKESGANIYEGYAGGGQKANLYLEGTKAFPYFDPRPNGLAQRTGMGARSIPTDTIITQPNETRYDSILINAGGSSDKLFIGGNNAGSGGVFDTERWGIFSYEIQTNNDSNIVELGFKEFYFKEQGKRIFDVSINGTKVLVDYDIYKSVGSQPDVKKFKSGKDVKIEFQKGKADFPKVSYLKIYPKPAQIPTKPKYKYYDRVAGYRDSVIIVKIPIVVRDSIMICNE